MAEELRTVLGFDAANAIATVAKLTASLNAYSVAMRKASKATSGFNSSAKSFEANVNKVNNAVGNTGAVATNSARAIETYSRKVSGASKPIKKLEKDTKKASKGMLISWESIVRVTAIQVIHQAVSKIRSSLSAATTASRDFVKSLAEIQSISGGVFNNLEELATQVEAFSIATGQALPAVTKGLYQTLSNQVVEASQSFEFMTVASDFSIAAVTDLSSSVNLLSSVLNSYNMDASEAGDVSGKLFKAIELGRFRGEEIADTFGRVAGLSAQLGTSFEEVLASMATLTRTGMKYNEAYTLITNVQLKLIKPTKALKRRFDEMGVATSEAGIQAFGFQGFLGEIAKGGNETATELGKLYGRVRAVRGALGLGAKHAETYADSLKKIKEAGAEATAEAKALVFETNAKQVELELNKLNVALNSFGKGATDVTKKVFDAFGGAVNTVKTFSLALGLSAAAWLLMRANTVKATSKIMHRLVLVTTKLRALKVVFRSLIKSPMFWAAAVMAGVALASYALNKAINAAKKYRVDLEAELTTKGKKALIDYEIELKLQREGNKKLLSEVQKILIARQKLYNDASKGIEFAQETMFSNLEDQLGSHISGMTGALDGFKDTLADVPDKLKAIADESREIKASISDWKFDRSIKELSSIREVYARIDRAQSLRNKATELAKRGEFELAKAVNERAINESKAAVAAADQTGNRALIAKAEDDAERSMHKQLPIQNQLKKHTLDQAAAIKAQIAGMGILTEETKQLGEIFEDLVDELKVSIDPKDRKRIISEMNEVANAIEKKFSDFKIYANLANKNELTKEFNALSKSFYDSLTGQVTTFEQAITKAVKTINAIKAETPDVFAQQAAAIELGKQLDAGTKAMLEQAEAQKEIDKNIELAVASEEAFIRSLSMAAQLQGKGRDPRQKLSEEEAAQVKVLAQQYRLALDRAEKLVAVNKANTPEFAEQIDALIKIKELISIEYPGGFMGMGKKQADEAKTTTQSAIENLVKINEAQKTVDKTAEKADVLKAFQKQVSGATDPVKAAMEVVKRIATGTGDTISTKITGGIKTATSNVQSGCEIQKKALQAVAEEAKRTAVEMGRIGSGGGAKSKARGGIIYRAGGGFTPRGTDTIPAMLSPGEFVVNAASSKRFFSQLVAMNSGKQPVYRAAGGPTNITVGDININESSSPVKTARTTVNEIRRELRRQSSTIGRIK